MDKMVYIIKDKQKIDDYLGKMKKLFGDIDESKCDANQKRSVE